MSLAKLLEWQNLIFLLPMVFALLLLGISMTGGGGAHDGDHDLDHHAGAHEIDTAETPHADPSIVARALDLIGIGRVPLSILLFTWCMLFGFIGLLVEHYLLGLILPLRVLNVTLSAIIAFVAAGFLTTLLARITGRVVPRLESYGEWKEHLINREAEVRYTVTATSGTVTLLDKFGNLQQLEVVLHESCTAPIPPHTKVILVSYNAAADAFLAVPVARVSAV